MAFSFKRFQQYIPSRETILASRWLSPFRKQLQDRRLWRLERKSVARGAAIGIFFAFMIPFGQFFAAALTALFMRANISIAMLATLVTNPFTFPPVYWLAYSIGSLLIGQQEIAPLLEHAIEAEPMMVDMHWIDSSLAWLKSAGLPLVTGLATLAVVGSLVTYFTTLVIWKWRQDQRRAKRRKPAA